ncbi:hypothetical protein B0H13DRAFT_1871895 [Mycena leptocephala]|nr:hypothetical protein B0H13DRAFT_1871895 [Mycena leptocephala]
MCRLNWGRITVNRESFRIVESPLEARGGVEGPNNANPSPNHNTNHNANLPTYQPQPTPAPALMASDSRLGSVQDLRNESILSEFQPFKSPFLAIKVACGPKKPTNLKILVATSILMKQHHDTEGQGSDVEEVLGRATRLTRTAKMTMGVMRYLSIQVEDVTLAGDLLVETVGDGSGVVLVDDSQDIHAGDGTGILGGLTLRLLK